MKREKRKRMGDLLLDAGLITRHELDDALKIQSETGKRLGEVLAGQGYVTQENIIQVLEFQLGIPFVSLKSYGIDMDAVKKISETLAKRHELIPIKIRKDILIVAMSDPLNIFAIDDVKIFTGMDVQPVIAAPEEIHNAIELYYGKQEALKAAEEYKKENKVIANIEKIDGDLEETVSSAPIVKLVNSIIEQAIRLNASDIHIEPYSNYIRIRYRIDGQLQEAMQHDIQLHLAIVSRIKIVCGIDIAEKRKPQDGRFGIKVDEKEYDLRASILPTILGEKVAIRIVDKNNLLKTKESLGLFKHELKKFNNILRSPHGMILITGPTGSGKTTTLYTTIRELNRDNTNVVTVEDPVEAVLEGINQVQVNPKAGLDFASALRAILRQDPNVIIIGEIRDVETVKIAVRAAVTGHLVVSTLHTNDAISAITRLLDMGIEPFLISNSLIGVISQRLVRVICPKCKQSYTPELDELEILGLTDAQDVTLYHGKGCSVCRHSGYQGRIGVYEIMPVSRQIRYMINHGIDSDEIYKQAVSEGMMTLKEGCKRLVLNGTTTINEFVRVSYSF